MQVTTFGAQLGLASELVDWYRDATSVPFGHLLIDLSPRTNDRSGYCTNTGSIPSKFYDPDRLKQSKILDDEHTNSLYSPSVPIIFPQMKNSTSLVLPESVYPVSLRLHSNSTQRKPAIHKKTSRGKVSRRSLVVFAKRNNLEAKMKCSVDKRRIATKSRHCTSCLQSFVLMWNSFFSYQLLCITRV